MHVPVVGHVLEAEPVRPERVLKPVRHARRPTVEVGLGKRVQERNRRGARLVARGEGLDERGVLAGVPAHVGTVEDSRPLSQRVRLAEHNRADDERLNVGEVPKHPQGVAPAIRSGEDDGVIAHLLNAG